MARADYMREMAEFFRKLAKETNHSIAVAELERMARELDERADAVEKPSGTEDIKPLHYGSIP
jgi:hypothetical protein